AAAAGRGGREGDVRSGLRGAVAGLAVGVDVQVGEVDYLLKPFAFEDLRARLERYAVQRGRLRDAVVRRQADVDRVLAGAAGPVPAASELPKGMSVETARLIERALRQADGTLSARECAE